MQQQELKGLLEKVRRRLVAFFQQPTTSPNIIVKVAKICGIKIPLEVSKYYNGSEDEP
jgi:hypothetical protein